MEPIDTPWVEELLAASFEERLHPYLPYCQVGLSRHLDVVLDRPRAFPGRTFWIALEEGGNRAGFAELFSASPGCDVLSYICTDPGLRSRGVARRLLEHHMASPSAPSRLDLDVFAHNSSARRLYERLGFSLLNRTAWWHRAVPEGAGAPVVPADLHGALASLERYGFCRLPVEHNGKMVGLGLTSRSVVRVPSPNLLAEDGLLSGVRDLLPEVRTAVAVGVAEGQIAPGEVLLGSERLTVAATTLRTRL